MTLNFYFCFFPLFPQSFPTYALRGMGLLAFWTSSSLAVWMNKLQSIGLFLQPNLPQQLYYLANVLNNGSPTCPSSLVSREMLHSKTSGWSLAWHSQNWRANSAKQDASCHWTDEPGRTFVQRLNAWLVFHLYCSLDWLMTPRRRYDPQSYGAGITYSPWARSGWQ